MGDLKADLAELAALTDIAFQKASGPLQQLAAREAELRQALDSLTTSVVYYQSGALDDDATFASRRAGADLAWDRWASARRAQLNVALAQVLAEKNVVKSRVKRAFARKLAADGLVEDHTVQFNTKRLRQSY